MTDAAAMPDQQMMGVGPPFPGQYLPQLHFDFLGGIRVRQADAPGHPENVGIHGDLVVAKGRHQHHPGGFLSHSRQSHQLFPVSGHLSVVLLHQRPAGGHDVFGLAVIQPAFPDHGLQFLGGQPGHGLRVRIKGKQFFGYLIDPLVRTLSGQDGGDQGFKGIAEVQFRLRLRVKALQSVQNFLHPGRIHGTSSVKAQEIILYYTISKAARSRAFPPPRRRNTKINFPNNCPEA